MELFKRLYWEYKKLNENRWERNSELKEITEYMTLEKSRHYLKDISSKIKLEVEDLNYDEKNVTLTYFKDGKKYRYSLIPVITELNKGNDYVVVRAEYIYSS